LRDVVRENRAFITRAITWVAGQGTRQYLDLGTGMLARPSAGDAARAVIPDARIAYIDHDPVVTMHTRVRLADDEGTAAADADLTDPALVLSHPDVRAVIDIAEPVCLIFGLVLSLMPIRQARAVVMGASVSVSGRCCVRFRWIQRVPPAGRPPPPAARRPARWHGICAGPGASVIPSGRDAGAAGSWPASRPAGIAVSSAPRITAAEEP
jgi:hypothetical protein